MLFGFQSDGCSAIIQCEFDISQWLEILLYSSDATWTHWNLKIFHFSAARWKKYETFWMHLRYPNNSSWALRKYTVTCFDTLNWYCHIHLFQGSLKVWGRLKDCTIIITTLSRLKKGIFKVTISLYFFFYLFDIFHLIFSSKYKSSNRYFHLKFVMPHANWYPFCIDC